jgi:sugar lactone lactonase YvrE
MHKLLDNGHFFEGARWRDGCWWVSDLYAHHVLRITPEGEVNFVAHVEGQPSGLGWLPDGTLLVVSMKDRRVMRVDPDGSTRLHADIHDLTGSYANDMVTDARGNAYVGNLGFNLFIGEQPRPADLVHVAPNGTARIVAGDMLFPNGMVVTPDGKTLVVAETFGGQLTAFTIAPDGSLTDRRIWATVGIKPPWTSLDALLQTDIMPDGCSMDKQGCIWMADAMNGRAVRIAESVGIIDEIQAPEGLGLYSCAVSLSSDTKLLVCLAPDYHEENRKSKNEACLYSITINDAVKGSCQSKLMGAR